MIVDEEEVKVHGTSRVDLVRTAWSELRFQKGIIEVDIQFVPIRRRSDITMDILVEGKGNILGVVLELNRADTGVKYWILVSGFVFTYLHIVGPHVSRRRRVIGLT